MKSRIHQASAVHQLAWIPPVLLLLLLLVIPMMQTKADGALRTLEGFLVSRLRIALPGEAVAVVEARNPRNVLVAATAIKIEGRQLPISYSLRVPMNTEVTLHAGIYMHGEKKWASTPVLIPGDSDSEESIEIEIRPYRSIAYATNAENQHIPLSTAQPR